MAHFKYFVNHHYFDFLKEDAAYFLGVLAADGNVSKDEHRITLGVCEKDKEIIEKFKFAIKSSHPIKRYIRILHNKSYPQRVFRFNSPHMCNVMKQYGIVPNKSLSLNFPELPEKLIPAFIRGYFDGDGSITITKQKNKFIYILGTKPFLETLKMHFNKACNTNVGWIARHNKSNIYHFCIHGNNGSKSFSNWIYHKSNADVRLTRKYIKMNL